MPDFHIIITRQCRSLSSPIKTVGDYEVDLERKTCTCKGFQYRKRCKHIAIARGALCGWHQQFSDEPLDEDHPDICPRCGGPTELVRFAV